MLVSKKFSYEDNVFDRNKSREVTETKLTVRTDSGIYNIVTLTQQTVIIVHVYTCTMITVC
jgi:hypothetical protein